MKFRTAPLTTEAFAPYGDVIQLDDHEPVTINHGLTLKFAPLALVQVDAASQAQLCLYRSTPVSLPFQLLELERHPLASQAFLPLHDRRFPVIVAGADGPPGVEDIRVFMTNGRQGINIHAGIWHHHQLSLDRMSDYIVVERADGPDNLETWQPPQPLFLEA